MNITLIRATNRGLTAAKSKFLSKQPPCFSIRSQMSFLSNATSSAYQYRPLHINTIM